MRDNLLELKSDLNSLDNFNRGLDLSEIDSEADTLESRAKDFFAITYKSKLIGEVIEIIDRQLKDNKSKLSSNRGGATVISGPINSGKTHTLITAYNLFRATNLALSWLQESRIKFNRFNVLNIEGNSKSALLSLAEIKTDKIWQPIFKELGREKLLEQVDEVPGLEVLEKLVGEEYTTLFIDDFEKFFDQLQANNNQVAIKANKTFVRNLLKLATADNRFALFIALRGENKELNNIFNSKEVLFKKTEELGEKEKVINTLLFKNKLSKEASKAKLSFYFAKCKQSEFDFNQEQSQFIKAYPFHPELLSLLDKLYQNNCSKLSKEQTHLELLANIFKNKRRKSDLLLVSDLDENLLENIFPEFSYSLNLSLKEAESKLEREILKVVFFYTVTYTKAEMKDIFKMVTKVGLDDKSFKRKLEQLSQRVRYLIKDKDSYYLKAQKDMLTLIKEETVSKKEVRERILSFNYKKLFPFEVKYFAREEIPDIPELNAVLFLDAPKEKEKLANFINQQLYQDYEYKNTLVPIIPKKDLYNTEIIRQMEKIIAMERIQDRVAEQEKMNNYLKKEKKQLEKNLKESFGYYIYWVASKNELKLYKNEFELNNNLNFKSLLEADKPLLKEYLKKIIIKNKNGVKALNLLLEMKRKKGAPFITEEVFKVLLEELFIEGDIIIKQKEILKDFSQVAFYDYILCPDEFKEERKISKKKNHIDKKLRTKLKNDIFAILSKEETGIKIEQLVKSLKDMKDYSDLDSALFIQMIEFLKVNNKLISLEGKHKIYKNTSSLLKDTKNMVSDKKARNRLIQFIAEKLFNQEYKVYKQDEIKDSEKLEVFLLLKDFASEKELEKFLKDEIYAELDYKDKLLVLTTNDKLFVDNYLNKMKLVIALSEIKNDISWDKREVEFVLKRQKRVLAKTLKDNFARCFLAQVKEAGIEIYKKEFEFEELKEAMIECIAEEKVSKKELTEAENKIAPDNKEQLDFDDKELINDDSQDEDIILDMFI